MAEKFTLAITNRSRKLRSLDPHRLHVARDDRYDGSGLGVRYSTLAPGHRQFVDEVYGTVKAVDELHRYMGETLNYEVLRDQLVQHFMRPDFRSVTARAASALAAALAAARDTDEAGQVMHDVCGAAIDVMTEHARRAAEHGNAPDARADIDAALAFACDHAKLMRSLLVDLDPMVRAADERAEALGVARILGKWDGVSVPVDDRRVRISVDSDFDGTLATTSRESSAVDRLLYNFIGNAARHGADDEVSVLVTETGPTLVRCVVVNRISEAHRLTLSERVGEEIERLFAAGAARVGWGRGLAICARIVGTCFGVGERRAVDDGYVGGEIVDDHFVGWFHWPAASPMGAE